MSLRQVCNYAYANLAEGRTGPQLLELDSMLVGPVGAPEAEDALNRANMMSMQALGLSPLIPPRR